MTKRFLSGTAVLCLLLLAACKKKTEPPAETLEGGTGGNATLRVTAKHHTRVIDSCTIYIKYKAKDMPAAYDDSARVQLVAGEPKATFSGLLKGSYYLYGRGWDPFIGAYVEGGVPYQIAAEDGQEATVFVTEGD